jgi:hypothetical protein
MSPFTDASRVTAIGATSPLPCAPEKVPSRSDLPTFVKSIAGRRFVEFTTYALASRLIASEGARSYVVDDGVSIPCTAVMYTGAKPT